MKIFELNYSNWGEYCHIQLTHPTKSNDEFEADAKEGFKKAIDISLNKETGFILVDELLRKVTELLISDYGYSIPEISMSINFESDFEIDDFDEDENAEYYKNQRKLKLESVAFSKYIGEENIIKIETHNNKISNRL